MTMPAPPVRREGLWIEWTFALITLGSVIYSLWFLNHNNYLPQPFFYEPNDIFADWFNTAYWARDKGTYDVWTALYPPASFVFLRLLGVDRCYVVNRFTDTSLGYDARDCDWLGLGSIFALYVIDVALIYITFRKRDKVTALPRTICLGLGWALLDGVERGNLVLAAFLFLMLAVGPLLRSSAARAGFAGLAINFKIYLIAAFVPLLLQRKWRRFEGIAIATILIYLVSYAILGRGSIFEIIRNVSSWGSAASGDPLDLWTATSYAPWLALLNGGSFPTLLLLGSRLTETLAFWIPLLLNTVRAMIVFAAFLSWLRPEAVPTTRVINLGLMMALITSDSGGYTPVYFTYLVFMEPWKHWEQKVALLICMIMGPSLDIPLERVMTVVRDTYVRHSTTVVDFHISVWPLIRPFVILMVAAMISLRTIRQVLADIDKDGWAQRWRFRDDVAFVPWALSPRALLQRRKAIPAPPATGEPLGD
ncbi:hypothetical protein [Novosphingobium sp.]|uniref:hypothetical protein n=1 Tax=Novosphingobium sp. TaxID=1874826 RepID=UPI0031DB3BD6